MLRLILFLGFVLAIASGVGCVFFVEMLGSTINNEKTIAAILGAPPLASIPYLEGKTEREAFAKKRLIVLFGSLLAIIVAVIIFHFIIMPLDVFWFRLLRVIGNI